MTGKNLTQEPPRSPKTLVGGYAILGRTLDKCRALLAGNIGEYHFDCPLDNMLFGWKRIMGDNFKAKVAKGASDEEMVQWVDTHGRPKTDDEKKAWVQEVKKASLYNDPAKRDIFIAETKKLGLDPATTTLFDWLDADDKASYPKAG
ncbi:MAG TPA: DUF5069 domain-containing protein [Chthoniobacterales bacterium]|nr:DUF5069 domain-containing protein [Chthoniobacterales bacterium]